MIARFSFERWRAALHAPPRGFAATLVTLAGRRPIAAPAMQLLDTAPASAPGAPARGGAAAFDQPSRVLRNGWSKGPAPARRSR
jgi:hypothetical protein